MRLIHGITIVLLAAFIMTATGPAAARDDTLMISRVEPTGNPVEHMPPIMRAAYLKGIREELIAHGYDPGPDDNAFDDRFTTAIQRYQLDAGLRPDGIASKELLEHLLFALPKVYEDGSRGLPTQATLSGNSHIALAPPARTIRRPGEEPVPSPAPRGRVATTPLPDDRPTTSRLHPRPNAAPTSRIPRSGPGGFVSRTQRALRERGYYRGPIDGRFSDGLANAIRAFQKNNRLPVTGVIDGPLLESLT